LCGLPDDTKVEVRAAIAGRRSAPVDLTVAGDALSVLDLELRASTVVATATESAPAPSTVAATPVASAPTSRAMREVERRRRRGGGSFLTRSQIDRLHASRVTDLLRSMSGVSIHTNESGMLIVELRGSRRFNLEPAPARSDSGAPPPAPPGAPSAGGSMTVQGCPADFLVDGMPIVGGSNIDSDVLPESIEVVEVYSRAQVPIELASGRGACGLVLIWTRAFAERSDTPAPDRDGGR
jgi:hypothetical protein